MGRADIEAPTIEEKEDLVAENEIETLPEMPELPAALDTALDTFIEQLDLQQSGPAQFVLGSALAATAERFGPSEAENLLARFDEEMTAEFFENLIDTGEIPQSPTMNNLLAGDVNSQAAQFILTNLAAQSASGAFITMQSNIKGSGKDIESKRRAERNTATALALNETMTSIRFNAYKDYTNASNDAERLSIFENAVAEQVNAWKEQNPAATPEQEAFVTETVKEATAVDMFNNLAKDLADGKISHEIFKEQIGVLVNQLDPGSEAHSIITNLVETQDNLNQAQEALAFAVEAAADGQQNAQLITHYRAEIEELRIENQEALQQLQELRDRLVENAENVTNLSLDELDALIAAKEAEITQMNDYDQELAALLTDLEKLGDDVEQTANDAEAVAAELEVAEARVQKAGLAVEADTHALGAAATVAHASGEELRAAGYGTITLQDIVNSVSPDELPPSLANFAETTSSAVHSAMEDRTFVVESNDAGELFVSLGDGTKLTLTSEMQDKIQTAAGTMVQAAAAAVGFRTDTEAGGATMAEFTSHNADLATKIENLINSDREYASAEEYLETVRTQANEVITILDGQRLHAADLRTEIDALTAQGKDTSAHQAELDSIYSDLFRGNTALGIAQTNLATQLGLETPQFTFPTSLEAYNLNDPSYDAVPTLTPELTFDLGASNPDYASIDFANVDFSTMDFDEIDFSTFSTDLTLDTPITLDESYTPDFVAYDLSYDFYDRDFFDFDYDTLDLTNFTFDDSLFLDTSYLLSSIDTASIENKLSSLQSDIDEIVQGILADETLPEGVDRAALEEAVRMDIEWSTENNACRAPEGTNVAAVLGADSMQDIAGAFDGSGFMGVNMTKLFNGMSEFGENAQLAMRISQSVDQAALDGRGERLVSATAQLAEEAGNTEAVAAADTGAESEAAAMSPEYDFDADKAGELARTITGPISREEMELIAETAGIPLEKLETAIIDLAAAEPDRGIEIAEPVATEEEPAPSDEPAVQIAEAAPSATNNNQTYDPMTLGA